MYACLQSSKLHRESWSWYAWGDSYCFSFLKRPPPLPAPPPLPRQGGYLCSSLPHSAAYSCTCLITADAVYYDTSITRMWFFLSFFHIQGVGQIASRYAALHNPGALPLYLSTGFWYSSCKDCIIHQPLTTTVCEIPVHSSTSCTNTLYTCIWIDFTWQKRFCL